VSVRDFFKNKKVRFALWTVLYILWVIWVGNYWWLLGIAALYELAVAQKFKAWLYHGEKGIKRSKNPIFGWIDAILFAVIVVTFINTFFIQAFKIPSSSMESSLMTGDHLFVSKLSYGPKLPQTPIAMPFVQNKLPFSNKESYSTLLQFDYRRLKGLGKVKRDDYVVFSFPHGDTVLTKAPQDDYYNHVRMTSKEYAIKTFGPIVVRPLDRIDHYVKRCVAVAGDSLSVIDGWVYVNGTAQTRYPGIQNSYCVTTNGSAINPIILKEMGINPEEAWFSSVLPGYPSIPLTDRQYEKIVTLANVVSVKDNVETYSSNFTESEFLLFPYVETHWTRDNYGPIWIPAKDSTVQLNAQNMPLYRRIIEVYEGNSFEISPEGKYVINGVETDSYTFKMDYYFMMGDNRHNSLDSRYWGFVPEDHVVGRPLIVWWSASTSGSFPANVRWKRLLKVL